MVPLVWFVTGTSSGFGRVLVDELLERGDYVVATLRRPEVLAELQKTWSKQLLVLALDVSKPEAVGNAFQAVKNRFGRIDVLVNNAGGGAFAEVEGTPDEVGRNLFEVNFWGQLTMLKAALPFMRDINKPAGGRIIQLSSKMALDGAAGMGLYSASKFAIEGLVEALAKEVDPAWNIKFSLICPGRFRTSVRDNSIVLPVHPAYVEPATLPTAVIRASLSGPPSPGDPVKAAKAIIAVALMSDPPFRLALGKDAVGSMRYKIESLQRDLARHEALSLDMDIVEKL